MGKRARPPGVAVSRRPGAASAGVPPANQRSAGAHVVILCALPPQFGQYEFEDFRRLQHSPTAGAAAPPALVLGESADPGARTVCFRFPYQSRRGLVRCGRFVRPSATV